MLCSVWTPKKPPIPNIRQRLPPHIGGANKARRLVQAVLPGQAMCAPPVVKAIWLMMGYLF
ncbi:MAG: hypothetical protein KC441_19165 [Anaerolineales bacterium]|nr:hypothetical protein [Anaerolineales bacterium]